MRAGLVAILKMAAQEGEAGDIVITPEDVELSTRVVKTSLVIKAIAAREPGGHSDGGDGPQIVPPPFRPASATTTRIAL